MGTHVSEPIACHATPIWPYTTLCLFIADSWAEYDAAPEAVKKHGAGYKGIGQLVVRCIPEFVRDKLVADGTPSKTIVEVSTMLVDAVAVVPK